jgi:thiamine-phosphate pyrophosphorylase
MASTESGDARRARIAAARLYMVCDAQTDAPVMQRLLVAAIEGGVEVVQLRDKRLAGPALAGAASRACAICHQLGALFIVNDSPEVARAVGADGVHVGQSDMPTPAVRALVGPDLLIGLSTHARGEIDAALSGGAGGPDYLGVGPVFQTPTKPGRAAVGVELVGYAASRAQLPFFAIGGIDNLNVGDVMAAGARRVAVVRAIAAAPDPKAAARTLRAALDGYRDGNAGYTAAAA